MTKDDAIGMTFLNLGTMSSSGGEIEGDNLGDSAKYFPAALYWLNVHIIFPFH